jgi:uncharacterized membrane protein YeiB
MYVAHTAPDSRLSPVLNLSEYLTYPLFAALVGAGAVLSTRPDFRGAAVRGAVLIVLGLLLGKLGAHVVVVLVYLGLLTWVAYPLARCRTGVIAAVGTASLVASTPVRQSLLDTRADLYRDGHVSSAHLLDYVATGDEYQLLSVVGFAAAGMVVLRLARSGPLAGRSRQLVVGGMVLLLAGGYAVLVRHLAGDLQPYEATRREHLFCLMLVVATMLLGLALAPGLGVIATTLAAMGRMALTLYVLQICYLSVWAHRYPGTADDRWVNTFVLIVGSAAVALLWPRIAPRGRFWRGPLEGAAQLLVDTRLGRRGAGPLSS